MMPFPLLAVIISSLVTLAWLPYQPLQQQLDNATDLRYAEQLRTALVAYRSSPDFTAGEVAMADLQPWIDGELPARQEVHGYSDARGYYLVFSRYRAGLPAALAQAYQRPEAQRGRTIAFSHVGISRGDRLCSVQQYQRQQPCSRPLYPGLPDGALVLTDRVNDDPTGQSAPVPTLGSRTWQF
ncbi:hypothetical protein [Serratia quinivorans]|uniref:hypothetical protein n=1 Tax=Serratia quinivorans TaxID=137545 RepID=UPI0021776516|nr:hypothetical protein [Serratia quinivorans]CAI1006776.1 Uncharacterised protein [Serratia quinivorans]CAI1807424.1 Uncharacterised protein [Serratia quinivorans]